MQQPLDEQPLGCVLRLGRPLSVGPVYERAGGRLAVAGVLAVMDGVVASQPFWELLRWLSTRCEWLRGSFAVASRPSHRGLVRADGGAPVVRFRGAWRTPPRLTLVVVGKHVDARTLEGAIASCLVPGAPLTEVP